MTSVGRWLGRMVLALTMAGCSDAPAVTPTDAGSVVVDTGAASDVGATDVPMVCDIGAPPVAASALPMIRGSMTILGGDGGAMVPTPSGGDATGSWVMESATMYWPAAAQGQLNPAGGSITGTGWGVFEGNRYRLSTDLTLRIDSMAAGVIARPSTLATRGTFVANGGALSLTPECTMSTGSAPGANGIGFSRDAPDRGRLFVTFAGAAGMATIVIDLRRVP